jgi:hypothetical protein
LEARTPHRPAKCSSNPGKSGARRRSSQRCAADSRANSLSALATGRSRVQPKGDVFTTDFLDAYIDLKWEDIYKFEHTPHPIEFEMRSEVRQDFRRLFFVESDREAVTCACFDPRFFSRVKTVGRVRLDCAVWQTWRPVPHDATR